MLQSCNDAPLLVPSLCRVGEFSEHALLGLLGRVLVGQGQLRHVHLLRQARVLLQPNDVLHAPALQALQHTRAAKAGVGPHDDLRLGPGSAQRHQQPFDQRADHAGRVTVTGAQHTRQHVLAGEDVQRQVAVVVVVGVEVAAFLLTVQWHVSGIDIEHQFLGRLDVAGDELPHQHLVQRGGVLGRGARLQTAERGRRAQWLGAAHSGLQHQIVAQNVVIEHVGPAQAQAVDSLRQQCVHAVPHA